MGERCFSTEEIGEILGFDPDDPRRRHVEECPRCSALAARYREYLDKGGEYPGPSLVEAQRKIREVIDGGDRPGISLSAGKGGKPGGFMSRFGQPMVVTFAIIVVAYGLLLVCDRKPPEQDLFERIAKPAFDPDEPLAPHHAVPLAKSVRLSWNSAPEAISYDLIIFDDLMNELSRFKHLESTEIEVERDMLPGKSKGKTFMWRVEMRTGEGGTGLSPVATFIMP